MRTRWIAVPISNSRAPVVRVPSQVHHGNHLNDVVADAIDQAVRKAMDQVSPDEFSFIMKGPNRRRFSHGLYGSIHFTDEFCSKIIGTRLVPSSRMLKLPVHIGVYINVVHSSSGIAGL